MAAGLPARFGEGRAVAGTVLAAAMSIYPILGQRYSPEGVCAATLMTATATSFVSITLLLWLVDAVGWLAVPG